MFKRYSVLQWLGFWFASFMVYVLQSHINVDIFPSYGDSAKIIGGYFWSGLIVVFWVWIINIVIKRMRNYKKSEN